MGRREKARQEPYWTCACGQWTWASARTCFGCGRRPGYDAAQQRQRWPGSSAKGAGSCGGGKGTRRPPADGSWADVVRSGRSSGADRPAASVAQPAQHTQGAGGRGGDDDDMEDVEDIRPPTQRLAKLRRALAALRDCPGAEAEAESLAARVRGLEAEQESAKPVEARLRSAVDRAASFARGLAAAQSAEADARAAWERAARVLEEAATADRKARADFQRVQAELAPAAPPKADGDAKLTEAVATVSAALAAPGAAGVPALAQLVAGLAAFLGAPVPGPGPDPAPPSVHRAPAAQPPMPQAQAWKPGAADEPASASGPEAARPQGQAMPATAATAPRRPPPRRPSSGPTSGRHGTSPARGRATTRSRSGMEGSSGSAEEDQEPATRPGPGQRTLRDFWPAAPRG